MRVSLIVVMLATILVTIATISSERGEYKAMRKISISVVPEDASLIEIIPISPYSYFNNDGELRIEINENNPNFPGSGKGLAPDTIHAFDCVFKIKNNLWTNQTVIFTIESSSESLLLYSPKSSNNDQNRATKVLVFKLSWKEEACVGVVIDTTNKLPGTTIEVKI